MSNTDLTVYLVDDDDDIRSSLSRALTKRGFNVQAFASAKQFLDTFDENGRGCLLLDYGMPEMNGLELQQHLVAKNYTIPIIFITGHGGVPESVQAIKAGAVDFLEKPFVQKTLVERINTAFETELAELDAKAKKRELYDQFARLTQREKEIAQLIATNPANTSSKDIGRTLDISPRTVDHHRARILEKMDVKSVAELIDLSFRAQFFKDLNT